MRDLGEVSVKISSIGTVMLQGMSATFLFLFTDNAAFLKIVLIQIVLG